MDVAVALFADDLVVGDVVVCAAEAVDSVVCVVVVGVVEHAVGIVVG